MVEALNALYRLYANFSGLDKTEALAKSLGIRILHQPWIQNGDALFFESPRVCKIPLFAGDNKITEEIALWTFYHDSSHLILNGTNSPYNTLEAEIICDNFALAMSFAHSGDSFLLCGRIMDEDSFNDLLTCRTREADIQKRAGFLGEKILHECLKIKKRLKGRHGQKEFLSQMAPLFRLANNLRA